MALLGGIIGGTRIGNMSEDLSNRPSPFRGDFTVAAGDSSTKSSSTSAYVGISLQAQKRVAKAIIVGSTSTGFTSSGGPTVTLSLYAKTGAAPANATDGTLLGQIAVLDTTSQQTIFSSDNNTLWNHVWVTVSVAVSTTLQVGALQFYQAIQPGDFCYTVLDPTLRQGTTSSFNGTVDYEDGYLSAMVFDSDDTSGAYIAADGKSSGLWYCEVAVLDTYDYGGIGISTNALPLTSQDWLNSSVAWSYQTSDGIRNHNGANSSYGSAYLSGDIIGCALNMNIGAVWMSKNGVWQNSATAVEIAAGTTTHAMYSTNISGKTIRMFASVGDSQTSGNFKKCQNWRFDPAVWTYTAPTGYGPWTHPITSVSRPRGVFVL